RPSFKFICTGIDLAHPPDLLPDGRYQQLKNIRVNTAGAVTSRQGHTKVNSTAISPAAITHSIRRLDNQALNETTILIGSGQSLYYGTTSFTLIEAGFSGNPLSLTSFRPNNDASPKMYVSDSLKMKKISSGGASDDQGITSPYGEPVAYLGAPNYTVADPFIRLDGWENIGVAGALTNPDRVSANINAIVYDQGSNGWCNINLSDMTDVGDGMTLLLNAEDTVIREIKEEISSTTVAGVMYDALDFGWCTVQLSSPAANLAPDTMVRVGSEYVHVTSVTDSQTSTPSFRCRSQGTISAGSAVVGIKSVRIHTNSSYSTGTSGKTGAVQSAFGTGTGAIRKNITVDLGSADGRGITNDDYLHFSVKLVGDLSKITEAKFQIDVDSTTNDFTRNYYTCPMPVLTLAGGWREYKIKIGSLVRSGGDKLQTLSDTKAFQLALTVTGDITAALSSVWVGGTYAPNMADGSVPYQYAYRYRSSRTGAKSGLSPISRTAVSAHREQVYVNVTASPDPQVDAIDLYRFGGGLDRWKYCSTYGNSTGPVYDNVSNAALTISEDAVFDDYKPFPVSYPAMNGRVNVVGTSVEWVSGKKFNTGLVSGNQITVNGVPTAIYRVLSDTRLETQDSGGSGSNVPYTIQDPIVGGTPLPCTWMFTGQGMGSYLMGVGDPYNPGYLHWCKPDDPDSASDKDYLEVSSPSEPLMNGFVWNGQCFVWTRDKLFSITPAFNTPNQFISNEVQIGRGVAGRWSFCVGAKVWFIDKHGVWEWQGGAAESLTDGSLYPLFPHDEKPFKNSVNGYYTLEYGEGYLAQMRLFNTDDSLFLVARDTSGTGGRRVCYRYDFAHPGWYPYEYSTEVSCFYADEGPNAVLVGDDTGFIYTLGGFGDSGNNIYCTLKTRNETFGDSRAGKVVGDVLLDLAPKGATVTAQLQYNNAGTALTAVDSTFTNRGQILLPFTATVPVPIIDNLTLYVSWQSSTVAPELFEWQPAVVAKPEESLLRAEDWTDAGFEGDKYMRGMILEANTAGQAVSVEVQYDAGTVGASHSVNHNGQRINGYPFTTPFIAHLVRLMPAVGNDKRWRDFRTSYIFDKYPELKQITTSWEDGGSAGRKYVRGMLLTADTNNLSVVIKVQSEGEVDAAVLTVKHKGLSEIAYAFPTPFLAHNLRVVPQGDIRIFKLAFIYDKYAELIPLTTEWSDLGLEGRKYVRGMILAGDTANASVTVAVEYTAGEPTAAGTQNVTVKHDGYCSVAYPFVPFYAHEARLVPSGNLGTFKIKWIYDPYPELIGITGEWSDLGYAGDKYMRGFVLEGDTGNANAVVQIQRDGGVVAATASVVVQDGKMEKPYVFANPFIAHELRMVPTSGNLGVFKIRWFFDEYPEIASLITPWTDAGHSGRKYVRGVLLTADSANVSTTIKIQSEGEVDSTFIVVKHKGLSQIPYPFSTPFTAHNLRIVPMGDIRIFKAEYIFDPYPELSTIITEWSDGGFFGDKFVRGMILEGDTGGVKATFQIQTDNSGTYVTTVDATHNGKVEKPYAFNPPFTAHLLRIFPINKDIGVFRVKWIFDEYAELSPLISEWSDAGHPGNKYVRGAIIEGDTNGQPVNLTIQRDGGINAATEQVTLNGQGQLALGFPPFNANMIRIVPDGPYRNLKIKWIYDGYPEQEQITGAWETAEYDGAKFMQGILLTGVGSGTLAIQYDESQLGDTINPSHSELVTKPYSFNYPFIAHNLRIVPTSGNFGVGKAHWVYEPAPEMTERWITQPTTHDIPGYHQHRDGYIAIQSNAEITFRLIYDDIFADEYTLPNTANVYQRIYVVFRPRKATSTSYSLRSTAGFRLYKKDCAIHVKAWGTGEAYRVVNPFGGPSRVDGAAI
ncbi:MAG TPA: hypothetical protein VF077_09370, partial [Nitrospiraceae bacterium]